MSDVATAPGSLQTPLWRAAAVYRIAALVYAAGLIVNKIPVYERPKLAWPVQGAMGAWTGRTT